MPSPQVMVCAILLFLLLAGWLESMGGGDDE